MEGVPQMNTRDKLSSILAKQDQEWMYARRWWAEALDEDKVLVWECIHLAPQEIKKMPDGILDIILHFATLGFRELLLRESESSQESTA